MAARLRAKDIDFSPLLKKNPHVKKLTRYARALIACAAVFLCLALLGGHFYFSEYNALHAKSSEIEKYLEKEADRAREAELIKSNMRLLRARIEYLENTEAYMRGFARLGASEHESVLERARALSVIKLDFLAAAHTWDMDVHCPDVLAFSKFIELLRASGLFSSLQYTGYAQAETGVYYSHVGAILKSGEGA